MTPGARVAASIEILDRALAGAPVEKVLTTWARGNRYAGSKDRAAIRDLVFDALRCRRSCAHLGGRDDGRGLMIGLLRSRGEDPASIFDGSRYSPPPLEPAERSAPVAPATEAERLDVPDWLWPRLEASLGDRLVPVLEALRRRAPVFLRANLLRATRAEAAEALEAEGIEATSHPLAGTALEVRTAARRVRSARAFVDGLVELQDAASQAAVALCADRVAGARCLDYCAGGGGKALALAALGARVTAHDVDAGRMSDLPVRASRAGAEIAIAHSGRAGAGAPYDLVFVDAPCSGSGAWRRQVEAKWRLTPGRLAELVGLQRKILDEAARLVRPGGTLAYATCSLLREENSDQVATFLDRHAGWRLDLERRFLPLEGGDGFYIALLLAPVSTRA